MWRDDRAVATTEGDIAEVLEAETLVDMQKLRELSTHGIPNNLRAEAWKYLLGVARPEKDEEMSLHRQNIEEYRELEEAWQVDAQSELTRKIKAELKRHRPELPFFRDARTRQRLERLLRAFLHGSAAVEFRPGPRPPARAARPRVRQERGGRGLLLLPGADGPAAAREAPHV